MKIIEVVVDAQDRFKQKRSDDFSAKVAGFASDVPNVLARENELEQQVRSEVQQIETRANALLKPHLLQIAQLRKEYQPSTQILDILSFELISEYPNNKRLARSFINQHIDLVLRAATQQYDELKQLVTKFDAENWPVGKSWTRYAGIDYDRHKMRGLVDEFAQIKSHGGDWTKWEQSHPY